ncbi:MAG: hypothetical protein ACYTG0_33270 [Planctomycetota bacterium]|jgi:hypothetical protein
MSPNGEGSGSEARPMWRRAARAFVQWARSCWTCRECSETVRPLETICPTCGARDPATIGVSPPVLVTFLGSEAAVLLLRFAS